MNRWMKIALPLLVVGIGAAILVALYWTRPEAETRPAEILPPLVRTQLVQPRELQLTVHSQGTVAARTESTLVPEVSGRVIGVSPSLVAGGFFEEDEILLSLDPTDYERAVIRARSLVAQARVRLAREEAEAEVARDEWRDLRGEEEAPPLTSRALQVAEMTAWLEAAVAEEEQAARDLERTRVRAPYAGRVREKMVDLGQFVSRGQALARVYAVDRAEVRLPLPDLELAYVDVPLVYRGINDTGPNPPVILRAEFAGRIHEWEGRIVRTEGEIDAKSRMVHVVAQVEDPYRPEPGRPPLAVGMFVEAEILGHLLEDVVVLPRAALWDEGRVLVVDTDQRLRFRAVEVVRIDREEVVVGAGLEAGEQVLLTPLAAVTDGMQVRVTLEKIVDGSGGGGP